MKFNKAKFKELREKSGLTLDEIAKKCKVSKQTVQKWEKHPTLQPLPKKILMLYKILNCKAGELADYSAETAANFDGQDRRNGQDGRAENEALKAEIEKLKAKIEIMKQPEIHMLEEISRLKDENGTLNAEIEKLKDENLALNYENKELTSWRKFIDRSLEAYSNALWVETESVLKQVLRKCIDDYSGKRGTRCANRKKKSK